MIVSIPDTITHQELERKLFLKKNYGEVLNHKLKAIIVRERVPGFFILFSNFRDLFIFDEHLGVRYKFGEKTRQIG